MAIELIDKVAPKNDGFQGMVDNDQIIGVEAGFLDEDNMASDSATAFASQQSIKKYVDDNSAAADDTAYNEGTWNANTDAATKNAIRDKIETMDSAISSNTSDSHTQDTDTALGSGCVAADHGTAATDQVVNVCYGTGSAPTASTTTEGTLFVKYTA